MKASRKTILSASKLAVFTVVSLIVTGTLVAIMGRFGNGPTEEYSAIFSNASLLQEGDDVRVAGVVLGKVESVDVYEEEEAKVTFSVAEDLPLTNASKLEIRYLNLVGDRYLTVLEGKAGAPVLKPGATIGEDHTTPALNLTALYNGFAPLFSALEPQDVNELSLNLIKVLQGEGGTIEGLLQHTASLTSAIADRDELVGQVIDNLNETLGTVDSRHQQITELVKELRRWVGGLAEDRVQIGRSVVNISSMTSTLADFLADGRPLVKADVAELRRLSAILARPDTQAVVKQVLQNLPEMLEDQTRTGTYGSWYNYYVCGAKVNIELPRELAGLNMLTNQLKNFSFDSNAHRCHLEDGQ